MRRLCSPHSARRRSSVARTWAVPVRRRSSPTNQVSSWKPADIGRLGRRSRCRHDRSLAAALRRDRRGPTRSRRRENSAAAIATAIPRQQHDQRERARGGGVVARRGSEHPGPLGQRCRRGARRGVRPLQPVELVAELDGRSVGPVDRGPHVVDEVRALAARPRPPRCRHRRRGPTAPAAGAASPSSSGRRSTDDTGWPTPAATEASTALHARSTDAARSDSATASSSHRVAARWSDPERSTAAPASTAATTMTTSAGLAARNTRWDSADGGRGDLDGGRFDLGDRRRRDRGDLG